MILPGAVVVSETTLYLDHAEDDQRRALPPGTLFRVMFVTETELRTKLALLRLATRETHSPLWVGMSCLREA